MVFLLGDIHGDIKPVLALIKAGRIVPGDTLVLLGDVGLNFYCDKEESKRKDALEKTGINFLCVHGNHERRPGTMPSYEMTEWNGGKVYVEAEFPHLRFAVDGSVYDLEGHSAIVIGGAYSVDKYFRLTNDWPWFPDEQPSAEIKAAVEAKLDALGRKVGVVLSHTCPAKYVPFEKFLPFIDQHTVDRTTEEWLDSIEDRLEYGAWYCGHWHINKRVDRMHFLFDSLEHLPEIGTPQNTVTKEAKRMRKLASIQRIWKIEPIEGADRIELAHVLGWQCVVNKGQFKPMDSAVYFEIDSFLPIRPEFEFLRQSSYKKTDIMGEGFKLRTMRFKGQISQGLLLPIGQFPEIPADAEIGTDMTELLGVRKWEIEERATTGGTVIGTLPYDIPHTDETRVQEEPELIRAFAGLEYYISTKMDGSSHSIGIDETGFHVTGHNYEYKDDGASSFYELVKVRGYRERLEAFAKENGLRTLTIQGELCAPGIQQNRLRLTKPEWYVFTVRENGKRVGLNRMLEVCDALEMEHVPIEEVDTDLPSKYPTVEALLERADGDYPNGGKKEGIVIRPTEPVFCPLISASLSMKVVSNKYLLKNEG